MSFNKARRPNVFRARHLALAIACLCAGLPLVQARADDYFNPALLDIDNPSQGKTDLTLYEKGPGAEPGKYRVDVYINNERIDTREIEFTLKTASDGSSTLQPCFTLEDLKSLGVKTDEFDALDADAKCVDLSAIPSASARFDVGRQQLQLSIAQSALGQVPQGYIPPEEFNEGINALLFNYSVNGSRQKALTPDAQDSRNLYANLRPGINLGPWRLRNYSTWSRNEDHSGTQEKFSSVYTYAERDIVALKSELTLGQSSSPADVFDSIPFTGAQLASDDDMLPDSLRGYAPVVHGIARSNAQVIIRQNGYLISQTNVAPGAFEINDLYPSGSSGDLNVTVKESDGSEQHFVVPYASVPVLQREGRLKYSLTGGRYRSYDESVLPTAFMQGTAVYGLPHGFTLYGGIQASQPYHSLALGVGENVGDFGAFSLDVTEAKATLSSGETQKGRSWRARYSKDIALTGATLSVAGYRFSSENYYAMQDVFDTMRRDNQWADTLHRRSREELTLEQPLGDALGSLNASLIQENYWNSSKTMSSLSVGYNNSWHDISYGLNYSLNRNTSENGYGEPEHEKDSVFSLTLSIPLERWLPNTWASYNQSHSKQGTTQNIGLNGTALSDNNLNWNIQQSHDSQGQTRNTSLNADYKGAYGELSAGYGQDFSQRQIHYGIQGGLIAHANGITFGQPMGETVALVEAPGANDTAIHNQTGVRTDGRGYTILPFISPYRRNTVALDTETLPADADVTQAVQTVTPTRGAVVRARFDTRTGARVLMTLHLADGRPVPFGATATADDTAEEFIVGEDGQVYLTGLQPKGTLQVSWGANASQRCTAAWRLPTGNGDSQFINLSAQCL
ncbi:fimbrial biogenesis outer membrane usher protein [Cronobacter sakazakii]|uniref:fimbria/pilus outer membrane usher protein n=1 Tax=Cronobacter sakazakii TaxID=28141 RepID=UPI001319BEB2|nr:fimbria/pilus outer membrane usher protein [Cronobacter sakazakii]EIZ8989674.1 fimbrial biogenesis outer membrane usher protein [Cronobacter sakazakii]EJV9474425.1 fimbrial biogenesis outer membrane usher protein [Cronobacter sakazakii]ELQ6015912.1 fimbrial biogenesis outer membrane usher protein [Cronobacter sakazakii]ELY4795055.1 fimbrial biogenesis outer membrane usher protein [Cronobacter sakazakii]NUW62094.1 fimbrial biogenesis outer membrane usher protein [Cronobacter sakazakii]